MSPLPTLHFLKLGGSLITDKATPHTARVEVIARLAQEIAEWRAENREQRLVIGHGSGSFGHVPARKYRTRRGVHSAAEWQGFVEVGREAAALHRLVMDTLVETGLPAVSFPPSACVLASDGRVAAWELRPLQAALEAGLLPVVYGDVVFDEVRGGTILSTEELFEHLARQLQPQRILLAGIEPGVWADFPRNTKLVEAITPESYPALAAALGGAQTADVTGGMASKVRQMLALAQEIPSLQAQIFSGQEPGAVPRALRGERVGTVVKT